jgi:tripartite-type tricarboxylate transporter receptor subunit TctC
MNFVPALAAFAMVAWQLAPLAAGAQQFPAKSIRIIEPMSPGGFGDVMLRAISQDLTGSLRQPVVVENRAGANTMIGGEACAKAAPDGYTICMVTADTLSYNPFIYKKPLYDAEKDFEPIIHLVYLTEVFMVSPALKVDTLGELIALAKSKPGLLNYASMANNVMLFMEAFKRDTGTSIKMIPYKGPTDAANALLGGDVQVAFFGMGNVIPHLKAGRIKPLAVDGAARSLLFPEVPTLVESGYRSVANRVWLGIAAPAGIPKPIVARFNSEITRIVSVPGFNEQYVTALGLEAILDTPEHFAQFLKQDRARAEKLVRQSSLQPE